MLEGSSKKRPADLNKKAASIVANSLFLNTQPTPTSRSILRSFKMSRKSNGP